MNPPTLLQRILGANSKVRSIVLGLAISYTLLRWPAILTGLPDDLQKSVFSIAHEFLQYGLYLALWFLKQNNVTGSGTVTDPHAVAQKDGSATVITPIVVALLIPALALSGCGTPFGIATANFLESPANRAIINIAVRSGVDSVMESYGGNISPDVRQPLTDAAAAATSSLSTGLIYAAAEALRTKQSTPKAASPGALTATIAGTGTPLQVAQPIATAVQSLAAKGMAPDVANEAVASTLDAAAAASSPKPSTGKTIIPLAAHRGRSRFRTTLPTLYSSSDEAIMPNVVTRLP